jgi:hypothetical protein
VKSNNVLPADMLRADLELCRARDEMDQQTVQKGGERETRPSCPYAKEEAVSTVTEEESTKEAPRAATAATAPPART